MINYIAQIPKLTFPPKLENINLQMGLSAIDRQQTARITKTALYILTTIATISLYVLSEAAIIPFSILTPAAMITALFWGFFFRLNNIDELYVKDLDDQTRSKLASNELEELLCKKTLNTFKDAQSLSESIFNINKIVACEVISQSYLETLKDIHKRGAGTNTFCLAAEELNLSLKLVNKTENQEQGWFNLPHKKRACEINWEGRPEMAINLTLKII